MTQHARLGGSLSRLRVDISLLDAAGERSVRSHSCERTIWIGRDPSCDVVLDSATVSRRHLAIDVSEGRLRVSDASINGVIINGERLHHSRIEVGRSARVYIGEHALEAQLVSADDEPAPIEAAVESLSVAQRRQVHRALLDHLDLVHLAHAGDNQAALRPRVMEALAVVLDRMTPSLPSGLDRGALIQEMTDEALGLGPLERLLADDAVSEIMVIDPATIFVERNGCIERAACRFTDDDAVRAVIERIVTPLGRRIDESVPLVDARLPDGSRVNVVIPPIALKGAAVTIRRFARRLLTIQDLVDRGAMNAAMARLLQRAVRARKNVLIAGGTGSGKTTLLNVVAASIDERERVVTIEDAAELRLAQCHVVSLEARAANLEGKGAFTIRDLVRNALRMRPDRIVVGECRGGEALDMLQAMNTGHEGSMTTIHANSPKEALLRLETLCLMAGVDLPLSAIRAQIAASVHVIVQQTRFSDGSRRVTAVSEVLGLDDTGQIQVCDVFRFRHHGLDADQRVRGEFSATGFIPTFVDELIGLGLARADDCL